MPLTLADGRDKLAIATTAPADPAAATVAELTAAIEADSKINRPDFRMSPTTSDTVPDQPLSQAGNAVTYGNGNFEASITVLRFLDNDGKPDTEDDVLWDAVKAKGTRLWLFHRKGPKSEAPWAAGDEYRWAEVITDDPQEPTDRAGYLKNVVPLGPQAWGWGVVASA